jgi:hypothetical protein
MCDHQIPRFTEHFAHIPDVVRTWCFSVKQIAGNSLMPAFNESVANSATEFTCYQYFHQSRFSGFSPHTVIPLGTTAHHVSSPCLSSPGRFVSSPSAL